MKYKLLCLFLLVFELAPLPRKAMASSNNNVVVTGYLKNADKTYAEIKTDGGGVLKVPRQFLPDIRAYVSGKTKVSVELPLIALIRSNPQAIKN